MGDVSTTYDGPQHCSATKHSKSKNVAMDCPYTGKGDEFSPTNLVEAALGGCMLLAMGAMATRHGIDLSGARINTTIESTDRPVMRFHSVDVQVVMPAGLSASKRAMLERAAEGCPIKHSFGSDVEMAVRYDYPD